MSTNIASLSLREATPLEMRRIFALVEGHFDETKGCYLNGYNDERVSKELNLPRALIAKVREESGLKIKGNPEVIALRSELEALKDLFIAEAGKIEGKLKQLEARQ
jgi:hypothetical protein